MGARHLRRARGRTLQPSMAATATEGTRAAAEPPLAEKGGCGTEMGLRGEM